MVDLKEYKRLLAKTIALEKKILALRRESRKLKSGNPYPKIVRCKICKKPIARLHRPASKEKILSVIRRHYKKYHPAKFHEWTKRG